MADWMDVDSLLKAYQNDLTKRATQFKDFYNSIPQQAPQQPMPGMPMTGIGQQAINSAPMSTPINWNDMKSTDNSSVTSRGGPSVVSRIFDILSRPGYAISESARQLVIDTDQISDDVEVDSKMSRFFEGLQEGWTGRKKTSFNEVLDENEYWRDREKISNFLANNQQWKDQVEFAKASGSSNLAESIKDPIKYSRFTDMLQNPDADPLGYKFNDKGEGSKSNAGFGLALDILTDPLNIFAGPIAKGVSKGVGSGVDAYKRSQGLHKLEEVDQIPYRTPAMMTGGNPSNALPASNSPVYVANKKVNPVLAAFSTSYKNSRLRPDLLANRTAARARAISRANALNKVARSFGRLDQQKALRIAQGASVPGGDPKLDALADDFQNTINGLFASSDLIRYANQSASGIRGNTDTMISDMNRELAKQGLSFRFGKNVDNAFAGNAKVDLSNGKDWLQGWRYQQIDDPLRFISVMSHAAENVTAKYQFLDEFAERFGKPTGAAAAGMPLARVGSGTKPMEHTVSIRNERLKGFTFDPQIAKEMNYILYRWEDITNPSGKLMKLFDNVTSLWKTGVTIYSPAHHIRNVIGDTYFNWMDGVNSVKPYLIAQRALSNERGRYGKLAELDSLTNKGSLRARPVQDPKNVALTTRGGIPITYETLYAAAYQKGLLQSAHAIEDISDNIIDLKNLSNPVAKRILNPAGGRVSDAVRGFTEYRDHFVKLAHFADLLKKSKSTNFETAVGEAARRVRKWHPDGLDLTNFERNVMRRGIPFYSWTRKAIPLVVETAVMRPGKTLLYPRFMEMIQNAQGVNSPSISDPFPEDQLFPDWIKEKGIGPISQHGMDGPLSSLVDGISRDTPGQDGKPSGYTIVNPSNPFIDTVATYGGMGRASDLFGGIGAGVNPIMRIPAEVATGQTTIGVPTGYDPANYAAQQIPFLNYLAQQGNVTPFGVTERGKREGIGNLEAFINFLTAAGIRGTGPYIKQSEFEAKERAKAGEY